MRILFVTPIHPWPLHGGPSIRIYHILRGLHQAGHQVTLVAGVAKGQDPAPPEIKALAESIHAYPVRDAEPWRVRLESVFSKHPYPAGRFVTPELKRLLGGLLERDRFDLAFVNFLYMVDALPGDASLPVVLDQHESEEMLWAGVAKNGSLPEAAFARVVLSKVPAERKRAMDRLATILCVSPVEAEDLEKRVDPRVQVKTVPNGVDVQAFHPDGCAPEGDRIVFVAGMGVRRNVDAAAWFAEHVLPLVRKERPDACFQVVGADPDARARQLGRLPGVEITGTVQDVRPYYRKAACVVLPYRYGAGTKLKLLEAMAMGRPVVTTTSGHHGFQVVDEEQALVRDDAQGFAKAVTAILSDDSMASGLGVRARKFVEDGYSWDAITKNLDHAVTGLQTVTVGATT